MQPADTNLFGEPAADLEQSQLFTPAWIARRMAGMVPRDALVLEPCCGTGNLVQGLLDVGHDPARILAIERDPRMARFARDRFGGRVEVIQADFFGLELVPKFDAVLGNFPFEDNLHLRFTVSALRLARVVTGIYPVTFEYTKERDRELWATSGLVTHRALLPERVEYANAGGCFESVVLRVVRRMRMRHPDDRRTVYEETWRSDDEQVRAQALAHLSEVP